MAGINAGVIANGIDCSSMKLQWANNNSLIPYGEAFPFNLGCGVAPKYDANSEHRNPISLEEIEFLDRYSVEAKP